MNISVSRRRRVVVAAVAVVEAAVAVVAVAVAAAVVEEVAAVEEMVAVVVAVEVAVVVDPAMKRSERITTWFRSIRTTTFIARAVTARVWVR
jgi:uncharacterized protein YebE (UPF0316 family)